jgi:uncharacterized membrane protein
MHHIRKNRREVIVSCLVILLPVLAGLLLWNRLPERVATHFDIHGTADGWSSRGFTVFGLPLFLLGVQIICVLCTSLDPGNSKQSEIIMRVVIWMVPVISTVTMASLYAKALGSSFSVSAVILCMSGFLFLIIGAFIPRAEQNGTIGIRVPWTLKDKEVWKKTHQLGGKTFLLGGLILLACMFLPGRYQAAGLILTIAVSGVLPVVYSWRLYHKKHHS